MICRATIAAFAFAYAAALGLLAVGTLGLFGSPRDPLAGVYVIVLGLPWVRFADLAPVSARPVVAGLAPAVNLAILWGLCAWARSRRRVR